MLEQKKQECILVSSYDVSQYFTTTAGLPIYFCDVKDGASPEQMHTVARRPIDAPPLNNSWQQMWRAIGLDKLLELLTESIEDGGR
jgi:hypothetical protein